MICHPTTTLHTEQLEVNKPVMSENQRSTYFLPAQWIAALQMACLGCSRTWYELLFAVQFFHNCPLPYKFVFQIKRRRLWKVNWLTWHELGRTKKKSESQKEIEPMTSQTPGRRFIYWATRTHGEQGHLTEFICTQLYYYCHRGLLHNLGQAYKKIAQPEW